MLGSQKNMGIVPDNFWAPYAIPEAQPPFPPLPPVAPLPAPFQNPAADFATDPPLAAQRLYSP